MTITTVIDKAYSVSGFLKSDGSNDLTRVSTIQVTQFANSSLAEFNKKCPKKIFTSINTLSGQQNYDLPSGCREILEVFYMQEGLFTFSPDIPAQYLQRGTTLSNSGYAEDLQEYLMNDRTLDEFRRYTIDYGSEYTVLNDQLFLINAPTSDSKVWFIYTTNRAFADLSDDYVDLLAKKVASMMCMGYALRQASSAGVQRAGGFVEIAPGSNFYGEQAKTFKQEFDDELLAVAKVNWAGAVVIKTT